MNRGFGRVQTAIVEMFAENPRRAISVEALAHAAFPDAEQIERKH
jgi:hypothetical protein